MSFTESAGVTGTRAARRAARVRKRRLRTAAAAVVALVAGLLALVPLAAPAGAASLTATLVQTIDMSQLDPPSPDSAGVTYLPAEDGLLVSDSEVNEFDDGNPEGEPDLYQGANLFKVTRTGLLTGTGTTVDYIDDGEEEPRAEPTGVALDPGSDRRDPSDDRLFVSNDDEDEVFVVRAGTDGAYGTADDAVVGIDLRRLEISDAEGVTFGDGQLFVVDGHDAKGPGGKVYRIDPGLDGKFGGNDETATLVVDVGALGSENPEGVAYNPHNDTLLVLDNATSTIYELEKTGNTLRNTIDVKVIDDGSESRVTLAGLAIAPGSEDSSIDTVWIADRGLDNCDSDECAEKDPDRLVENDGKLHEVAFDLGQAPGSGTTTTTTTVPDDSTTTTTTTVPDDSTTTTTTTVPDDGTTTTTTTAPSGGTTDDGTGTQSPQGDQGQTVSEACSPDSVPQSGFTDIDGNPHAFLIDCAAWWEVVSGTSATTYSPALSVNRGQIATFVAGLIERSGGTLPVPTRDHFPDDNGNAHEANINRLAEAELVRGNAEGNFHPEGPVTRAQIATLLVGAHEHRTGETLAATSDHFTDDNGNVHESNIDKAAEAGIAEGVSAGIFDPHGFTRRDQMASFVMRVMDLFVQGGHASPPTTTA